MPRQAERNAFLDRMQEVVGFDWRDVNHFIEINIRRNRVAYAAVFGGDFDQAAIDTALTARGFDTDEREGIPVWHRMEDDDLDINSEEAADPFGNGLYAARIALNDNQLFYSQNWPTLDAALDGPSLASRT
jgi:hypothetical protein